MRRAVAVQTGPGSAAAAAATVTLAAPDRYRRRLRMTDDAGDPFLLDLPRAVQLKDGDLLMLEAGGCIHVVAAEEDVLDITCADAAHLARVAWHIGNRHVPVQLLDATRLRVPADPVMARMLEGQGVDLVHRRAKFQPEPGAYDPHGLMDAPPPLVRRA